MIESKYLKFYERNRLQIAKEFRDAKKTQL